MVFYGLMNPLVIRPGLEPGTHSLEGCCSIQLSYQTNILENPLHRRECVGANGVSCIGGNRETFEGLRAAFAMQSYIIFLNLFYGLRK